MKFLYMNLSLKNFSFILIFSLYFINFTSYTGYCTGPNAFKTIMLIHSYESGQVCGKPQADGILSGLAKAGFHEGKNLHVEEFFMDTKTNYTSKEQIKKRGFQALSRVQATKPDLVITIDDNAAKTVMRPKRSCFHLLEQIFRLSFVV